MSKVLALLTIPLLKSSKTDPVCTRQSNFHFPEVLQDYPSNDVHLQGGRITNPMPRSHIIPHTQHFPKSRSEKKNVQMFKYW